MNKSGNGFEEKRVSSQLIFDGRIIRVERDDITLPDGRAAMREVVRHPGAVCVVPLGGNGDVICVRQFRYPFGRMLLEIPAGKLEPGEDDTEAAARRELAEETGARCGRLTFIGEFFSSPAIFDENIRMYLAEDLTWGERHPDDDEFLDVERLSLTELCRMVASGEIPDGKTQAAILKVAYILAQRNKA